MRLLNMLSSRGGGVGGVFRQLHFSRSFLSSTTASPTFPIDSMGASVPFPEPKNFLHNFALPLESKDTSALSLHLLNSHPNDQLIEFDSVRHKYKYQGLELQYSVTQFLDSFFPKFNTDEVIEKMMNGNNWPRPQYQKPGGDPFSAQEIKDVWERQGLFSRNKGTWMHFNIERFLNNAPANTTCKELQHFLRFYEEYIVQAGVIPFRTEWLIAAPNLSLGGSVDFVGKLPSGNLVLMDWKRSKGLLENLTSKYGKKAFPPLDHLDDCEGSKYSLQLNLYKYILETYYGAQVEEMKIGVFHPNDNGPGVVNVPDLQDDVRLMIKKLEQLQHEKRIE